MRIFGNKEEARSLRQTKSEKQKRAPENAVTKRNIADLPTSKVWREGMFPCERKRAIGPPLFWSPRRFLSLKGREGNFFHSKGKEAPDRL